MIVQMHYNFQLTHTVETRLVHGFFCAEKQWFPAVADVMTALKAKYAKLCMTWGTMYNTSPTVSTQAVIYIYLPEHIYEYQR